MIPRIETSYYPSHRRELPTRQAQPYEEPSLFTPVGASLRKMVVMVDADLLVSETAPCSPQVVLANLLAHPYIRCYRYADGGPPSTAQPAPGDNGHVPIGWVTRHQEYQTMIQWWDGTKIETGHVDSYYEIDLEKATHDQALAVQASKAAAAVGADIFITEREYLLSAKRWLKEACHRPAAEPPCYNIRDALAVVGLYLRAQGEYHVGYELTDEHRSSTSQKKHFYWTAARILVPAILHWGRLVVACPKGNLEEIFRCLVGTVAQRVEFALWQRDAVHRALNQSEEFYAANDAFASLDNCLILLMGALDACARVVHHILTIEIGAQTAGNPRGAGWHRERWVAKLNNIPALAPLTEIVAKGSPGCQVVTILKILRNTVHGEALFSDAVMLLGNYTYRPLISLPQENQRELREAIQSIGNYEDWGIQEHRDRLCADPGMLMEQLFPRVTYLLNDLMARTPLDTFHGATISADDRRPPSEFTREIVLAIRWQLGM